jgi:hypothetical protein
MSIGPGRLVGMWQARRRRHREALAASKRLGRDDAAWAELFRREDWGPKAAGHLGACGQCGKQLDPSAHHCPYCGAEWRHNTRRSDLYRQALAYGAALALSALAGYLGASWLRARFAAIEARGDSVNPEMVDTLSSFTWLFCSVLMMIGLTYAIERLAPIGHWRKAKAHPAERSGERRRRDERG